MSLFDRLLHRDRATITVVSGLPRSGTSMMMDMLRYGGTHLLVDDERIPDDSNPRGYFEYQPIKRLKDGDLAWLPEARGKAVKIISALLEYLPEDYRYDVIFIQRALDEVLASQTRMLQRDGKPQGDVSDDEMRTIMEKHLHRVRTWLDAQPNMRVLYIHYADILSDPLPACTRLSEFLGGNLDVNRMAAVVDPSLYHERGS